MEKGLSSHKLVTDAAGLADVAKSLEGAEVLGVDIETTGLSPRDGRIRLLQLATPDGTYVVDVFEVGALAPLKEVLEGGPTKVLHNCLPLDTLVLTPSGWTPIGSVKAGDTVMGYERGEQRWTRVTEYVDGGVQKLVETSNSRRVWASTPTHRWLCEKAFGREKRYREGYFDTASLKAVRGEGRKMGIRVKHSAPFNNPEPTRVSSDEAALLAWLWGDGNIHKPGSGERLVCSITQSEKNRDHCPKIEGLLRALGAPVKFYRLPENPHIRRYRVPGRLVRGIYARAGISVEEPNYTGFVLGLSRQALESWFRHFWFAEGSRSRPFPQVFCQRRKANPDKYEALLLAGHLLGYTPMVGRDDFLNFGKPTTSLRRLVHKDAGLHPVACLVTETSNFVMRQGDFVTITGNSKFDHAFLYAEHGVSLSPVFDTMLAAQLLSGGNYGPSYALEAVAERYADVELDKTAREEDWSGRLSGAQLEYAARDAAVLLPLRERLTGELEGEELGYVAGIEFRAVATISEMELAGIKLDLARWKELEKTVRERRDAKALELEAQFPQPEGILPLEGLGPSLNLNSPKQITDAFRSLGIELPDTKVWTLLKVDHPAATLLLEYRELQKKLGTYLEPYPSFVHPKTGRIHANFLQCRVPTGRLACIAEGSLVDAPRDLLRYPRGIPIEKISEGDYVYSFDRDGIPKPRKVLRVLKQGRKKVLKLVWRGVSNASYLGEMKATPDHLVRLTSGAYKRMDELKPGDKLMWMRRSVSDDHATLRWSGMGSISVKEHKHLVRGETVHHKDGNKLNNSPENLAGMPRSEHSRLHPSKPLSLKECPYSEEVLVSMLSRGVRRAARYYHHDYSTLKRWAAEYGIEMIDGRRRQNHHVVAVLDEGEEVETYDLTIEETPNFVVNEICVHNCTSPNIQQIPHEDEFRRCFVAEEGNVFVIADYSQIELRILAEVSGDPAFVEAFRRGDDLHRVTAATMYGVPMEQVTKEQRSDAKRINFGLMYGRGARSLSAQLGTDEERGRELIDEYFSNYPKVQRFLQRTANRALRDRTLRTLAGRVRKFGDTSGLGSQDRGALRREAMNYPIQGCLLGSTRVFEKSLGYVPIRSLVGRDVSVWDGERFSRASVVNSGKKRLTRVVLKGGHEIGCSPDHKFLVRNNNGGEAWKRAGEIRAQERAVLADGLGKWELDLSLPPAGPGKAWNVNTADLNEIGTREELGEWLGRVASDGGVGERQITVLIAEHEEVLLPKLLSLTERLGHVTHQTRVTKRQSKRLHRLTLSCKSLARQMKAMGVKERIPDVAWRSRSVLCGYLRGLFDGDGTAHPDGPVLTFGSGGKHLGWAREVQEALLLLGIRSRIGVYDSRVNVRVMKKDVPLFCSEVGFVNPVKQQKAEAVVSSPLSVSGKISAVYGRAQKVECVEIADEWVEMYDVVDSETGRFAANGIVVHNSSADIAKLALVYVREELRGLDARLVNCIHDEFVVECEESQAPAVEEKTRAAMLRAGEEILEKVPVEVEVGTSPEWRK